MLSIKEKKHVEELLMNEDFFVLKNLNTFGEVNIYYFKKIVEYILNNHFPIEKKELTAQSIIHVLKKGIMLDLNNDFSFNIPNDFFAEQIKKMDHTLNDNASKFEVVRMLKSLHLILDEEHIGHVVHSIEEKMDSLNPLYLEMLFNLNFIVDFSKYKNKEHLNDILLILSDNKISIDDNSVFKNIILKEVNNSIETLKEDPFFLLLSLRKLNYKANKDDALFLFDLWFKSFKKLNNCKTIEDINLFSLLTKEILEKKESVKIDNESSLDYTFYEVFHSMFDCYFNIFNKKEAYHKLKEINRSDYVIDDFNENISLVPFFENKTENVSLAPFFEKSNEKSFEINDLVESLGNIYNINNILLFDILNELNFPYLKDTDDCYISFKGGKRKSFIECYITKEIDEHNSAQINSIKRIMTHLFQEKMVSIMPKYLLIKLMADFPFIKYDLRGNYEPMDGNEVFFEELYELMDDDMEISDDNYDLLLLNHKI